MKKKGGKLQANVSKKNLTKQKSTKGGKGGVRGKSRVVESFGVCYPLSQSNSYIVFSDKDQSLNSTNKALGFQSRKPSTKKQAS